MARFDGKTILITGGTSGIGLATAKRIQSEGGRVVVTGSRQESLARAETELGGAARVIQNDAAQAGSAEALARELARLDVGGLDGLFLNAGFGRFQPLEGVTAEEVDAQFAVNVRTPLLQARALATSLGKGGSILFTTSVVQHLGMPGAAIYSATKGALRPIVRVLAKELSGKGIRVNAVSPGPIATSFFERTGMPTEAINEFGASILASVPLGRFGTSEEVAAVAAFLLSNDASFVTGSEYNVDGGFTET